MAQDLERRLGDRTAMRARGTILGDNNTVTDVYVLDQSISGVRLELPVGVALTRKFRIRIGELETDAEMVWRNGFQTGVRFVRADEEQGRVKAAPPPIKKMSLAELRSFARKQA
jgi:hypothetical protein